MPAGAATTFLKDARTNKATVLLDGVGDSRFRRNGHGVIYGAAMALAQAAGGWRGLMLAHNVASSGALRDGLVPGGRSTIGALYGGVTTAKPAGCTGIPIPGRWAPRSGSLQTSLTETATGSINISGILNSAGAPLEWPAFSGTTTTTVIVRIGDELISLSGGTFSSGTTYGFTVLARGYLGSPAQSHSVNDPVYLWSGPTSTHWLGHQHAYLRSGTLSAGITNSDSSLTLTAGQANGWPLAGDIRVESEYMSFTRTAGSDTLTLSSRGKWTGQGGSAAAAHSAGATVALAYWDKNTGVILHNVNELGHRGPLRYVIGLENPGLLATGPHMRPAGYKTDGTGHTAIENDAVQVVDGGSVNPTWSDTAGTLGSISVVVPGDAVTGRDLNGLRCSDMSLWPGAGPCLLTWQAVLSAGRPGGLVQTYHISAGGRRLSEVLTTMMRDPEAKPGMVRKMQFERRLSANANGGNGKSRLVWLTGFASNDLADSSLCFCTAGQSWTAGSTHAIAAAYTSSQTTIQLVDATGLPTVGHGLNPTTGERFSWAGITSNTLQNVVRGDFGTTAAASATGSDTLWFGHVSATPTGFAANTYLMDQLVRSWWNLSTIAGANASYPHAAGGTFQVQASETAAPNAATEVLHLLEIPNTLSDAPTPPPVGAMPTPTYAQRQGRYNEFATELRTRLDPLLANFEVVQLGASVVTAGEGAAANFGDISAATTLGATITSGATTLQLPIDLGTEGFLQIDSECIQYTGRSGSGPYTYTVTRGVGSTIAAGHSSGAVVTQVDPIHQTIAGFTEAWKRWASKNVVGSGGIGGQAAHLAEKVKVGFPVQ